MGKSSIWDVWREPDSGRAHARMASRKILVEAGITSPPVNPFMLLRNYRCRGIDGVDIEWFSGIDIDGWSGYSAKHRWFVVFINSQRSYVKNRWTGAHELGHAVLKHSLHPIDTFDIERDPEEERQADIFAEELLIPTHFLQAVLKTRSVRSIDELVGIFHASREAIAIALRRFLPERKIKKLMSARSLPVSFVDFIETSTRIPVLCPHCGTPLYPTKRTLVSICACGLEIHLAEKDFIELMKNGIAHNKKPVSSPLER